MRMVLISVIAMNLGLLCQNYAEFRGGGPKLLRTVAQMLRIRSITPQMWVIVVILVSVFVFGLSMIALKFGYYFLISMIASALTANAFAQLWASLRNHAHQPGTLTGLIIMAPASIWAMYETGVSGGSTAILCGVLLSIPFLILLWLVAVHLALKHQ